MSKTADVTLNTILEQFRDDARNNRDLGDRFERLIVAYLQLYPLYVDRFSDVWMGNDRTGKQNTANIRFDVVGRERRGTRYSFVAETV